MNGIFKSISNFIGKLTGESRRKSLYAEKQRAIAGKIRWQKIQDAIIPKTRFWGLPQNIQAFRNRLKRRRIKNLMSMNTKRKCRGLFEYAM